MSKIAGSAMMRTVQSTGKDAFKNLKQFLSDIILSMNKHLSTYRLIINFDIYRFTLNRSDLFN